MTSCLLRQCHSLLVVDTLLVAFVLVGHRNKADPLAKQALEVDEDLRRVTI